MQGNSVLALAGLAQAVFLFVQQQTSSGATEQYQRNTEWLSLVADTIMVVLDGNHKPKGPTLIWCQQVNSSLLFVREKYRHVSYLWLSFVENILNQSSVKDNLNNT